MNRSMPTRASVRSAAPAVALLVLAACGGGDAEVVPEAPPAIQIAAMNISVVDSALVETGPTLSGTLVAARTAQLRAQVGGTVLSLLVQEGQPVTAGQLLAVIDTMAIAEQARSARLALQSAEAAARSAARNLERSRELLAAGAIAARDTELAEDQALAATAALAEARSRLASARKQLEMAFVRAPFAGVVSEVPVSVGDVVQTSGNAGAIATVVDPSVLDLEATVASSHLGVLQTGTMVEFAVPAFPGEAFRGAIARLNPTVDAMTGQIRLYVRVPNADRKLAAGLFAEGRVAVTSVRGVAVPLTALDVTATTPTVRRVRNGVVESVAVTVGARDDLRERVEITSGVSVGDTVLIGAAISTPVGATVRITRADT